MTRTLRYLAPNLITTANLVFGMLSLSATARGDYIMGGWFIIYAVLGDRLDGFVARLVRGTSEFGVQMDSFADFLNFGIAPAYLMYKALGTSPQLPMSDGMAHTLLMVACSVWILACAVRLARYNITSEDGQSVGVIKIFFGVPTTLAGGTLVTWFLALYKYSPTGDGFPYKPEPFSGMLLLGELQTPTEVWRYIPIVMLLGAYLMVSSLRVPKLGVMRSKVATAVVFVLVISGGICGYVRVFPEYMVAMPSVWLVVSLIWGQLSPAARRLRPAPIFPRQDPPPGREPVRPEDDLLPEGADSALDPPDDVATSTDAVESRV